MNIESTNSLVLAYLGDSVYELLIREYFIKQNISKVNTLQSKVTKYVSAKGQAKIINYLIDNEYLKEDELIEVKRGRNAKVYSHPKNTDIVTYKWATAFECLFGYLYLKEDKTRIDELMKIIIGEEGMNKPILNIVIPCYNEEEVLPITSKLFLDKIYELIKIGYIDDKYILDYLRNNNIKIINMDKREMDEKYGKGAQGIVLDIEDYEYHELNEVFDSNFVVILDHLEDPHNFGAIIRTSEAAGVDYIIIPKNRSVEVNSTVMKVSAGALNNIKIVEVNNLVSAMEKLKDNGFWIYATDMDGEEYTKVEYAEKTALVIGAEGTGVSKRVGDNSDFIISIPMFGKINSLNASVAAGIAIYEVVRQRKQG